MRGRQGVIGRGTAVAVLALCAGGVSMAAQDSADEGKQIFTQSAQPPCAACHTLSDAGSQGPIGPDLDALAPSSARVYKAVTGGVGAMPPYEGSLSESQRRAVADYVSSVTGGG